MRVEPAISASACLLGPYESGPFTGLHGVGHMRRSDSRMCEASGQQAFCHGISQRAQGKVGRRAYALANVKCPCRRELSHQNI